MDEQITAEQAYRLIYTHEEVYIPPAEHGAAALEVGLGCSWHKCLFCDFARDEFCIHPMEKIEQNLFFLSQLQPDKEHMFFLGENIFCLPAQKLYEIIVMVRRYMPNIRTFAMYSRADDVLRKTPQELQYLKDLGVIHLHIGLESGSDSILSMMNKGVTTQQFKKAFRMLDEAGIDYYVTIIPGLGGRAYSSMHAIETANLLNSCHPKDVWCLKLKLWPGTPLAKMAEKGEFEEMTPFEILQEDYLMVKNLNPRSSFRYTDSTVLDQFTVRGDLPAQKQEVLKAMDYLMDLYIKEVTKRGESNE